MVGGAARGAAAIAATADIMNKQFVVNDAEIFPTKALT